MISLNFIIIATIVIVLVIDFSRTFSAKLRQDMLERQERLSELANKDPLTGLLNRNAFYEFAVPRMQFLSGDASIVLCDIDDFKKLNDAHGHAFGDEALKIISNAIKSSLREGDLDDKEIEIEISQPMPNIGFMGPAGMEEFTSQLQGMMQSMPGKMKPRKLRIADAMKLLIDEEAGKLVNDEEVKAQALSNVEQNGIVFLDEIDKIAVRNGVQGGDVSRQGVQRDLLPLVEGTAVNTRHGSVKTDHILFIASGAFHLSKPSDLVPELQGRFPIRVELSSLSVEDFRRILTETDASLTKQYQALLGTEGVTLDFRDDGIQKLAETAFRVNEGTENIGARRLQTVMERLLEELSYQGDGRSGETVVVDAAFVEERLGDIARDEDLSRYVL